MKMTKQRLMGLALVVTSVLLLFLASTGETLEERDATAVLIILPLGMYMMVTKNYVLYDGEEAVMEKGVTRYGRKKTNCRGSRLQDVGRSRCRTQGGR